MTSTNIHLEAESTKKFNIPLSHLEFSYITNCTNVKELEKIVRLLRSGSEGKYPELELFAEERLRKLDPKSRVLRKDGPILRPGDLSSGDWKQIEHDLQSWASSMNEKETKDGKLDVKDKENIIVDENLPAVRATNIVLEGKKLKKQTAENKKPVMPRDYKEWDKFDVEAELKKTETQENQCTKPDINGVTTDIQNTGLSQDEKERKANREKDKGNEAFQSKDFKESVVYYTRSISLLPTAASYNNRALAYLKLEEWDKALADCNSVLNIETSNVKALLRRATAYKSKNNCIEALVDLEKVLAMEPNNKIAKDMFESVNQSMKLKKEQGKRLVIEEVEESDEEIEPAPSQSETQGAIVKSFDVNQLPSAQVQSPCETDANFQSKPWVEVQSPIKTASSLQSKPSVDLLSSSETAANLQSKPSEDVLSSSETAANLHSKPSVDVLSSSETAANLQSKPSVDVLSSSETAANLQYNQSSALVVSDFADKSALMNDVSKLANEEDNSSEITREETTENLSTSRPVYVQLILPSHIQKYKDNGNLLFRSGQYGDARDQYTKAISELEKVPHQEVNLAIVLNNRAACHLKTGNSIHTVEDCTLSLSLVPHNVKALLRRAAAYESVEKYLDAYVDYKHVLGIDKSNEQAVQGANRCQNIAQSVYGSSWRQKIPPVVAVKPWQVPIITEQSEQKLPNTTLNSSSPSESTNTKVECNEGKCSKCDNASVQSSKMIELERLKQQGNDLVQKGQYEEAVQYYSSCISLCPEQTACFTNRALCFLKLNKPTEAAADCTNVLNTQANNPKALYRRALAHKMMLQYKASLQDLIELLKLEPKNCAAQKEMDCVKMLYKQELEKLKISKSSAEQETKIQKRLKIEEYDDEEEDHKLSRDNKSKSQGKGRNVKNLQQQSTIKSKVDKKPSTPVNNNQTPTPPIASRLMKTTPYEFYQAWNSLKPSQGSQPYAEILRQVSPGDLHSVISNKLDGQMLQIIVRCVHEEMVAKGEIDVGYQFLDNLCKVPRFSTVSMFMSSKEKKEVSTVLDILSQSVSTKYTSADIVRLKREYSVK